MELYKSKRKLLLGSASTSRTWILEQIGIPYSTRISNLNENNPQVDEITTKNYAKEVILSNSKQKRKYILQTLTDIDKKQFFGVLCLDTCIWLPPDNYISKPATIDSLRSIMKLLSNKTHFVLTAFSYACIDVNGNISETFSDIDECAVLFKDIHEHLLDVYLSSSVGIKFAGGYNIQGSAAIFIKQIKGDFYTVVGIPLSKWLNILENKYSDNYKELINSIEFH